LETTFYGSASFSSLIKQGMLFVLEILEMKLLVAEVRFIYAANRSSIAGQADWKSFGI